jgi:branched-chain amino acid transport system ATP-binding protein
MTADLLAVDGVRVAFAAVEALQGVSLKVGAGEIVTVIGSNGAGKTTLMKAIAGLLAPKAGRIAFDGADIAGIPAHQVVRRGIALVPEGRQVFARLTVEENLNLGAYGRTGGARPEDFERCLRLFPWIGERCRQRAGTLSGGEQQMLAIARGLMSRPKLLLMDEPSLGLAPMRVREVFSIIEGLRRQGTTVLMVEQMARLALRISDRAYVLEHGRIVAAGASAELLRDPRLLDAYLGARRAADA